MTQKVIMFAMVIALSYAAAKIGWLGENVRNGLSRLIINLLHRYDFYFNFVA
jgi:hypothetical protein